MYRDLIRKNITKVCSAKRYLLTVSFNTLMTTANHYFFPGNSSLKDETEAAS